MSIVDAGIKDVVAELSKYKPPALAFSTSTGVVTLDLALGGGLPSGAVEIYGPPSAGKSSLILEMVATAQRQGHAVALCPSEYLDIPYMRRIGVDLDHLLLITANTGEWTLEVAFKFIEEHRKEGQDVLLAIDSATSLRPVNDEFGEWNLMLDHFLNWSLPELGPRSVIVMTNQIRTRRSIQPEKFFVNGDIDSTARRILDRFSARLELSRTNVTDTRFTLVVNIVANVLSKPGLFIEVPFLKGSGVDTLRDLVRAASELGVIERFGSWLSFEDATLGHGESHAVTALEASPALAKRILDRLMEEA